MQFCNFLIIYFYFVSEITLLQVVAGVVAWALQLLSRSGNACGVDAEGTTAGYGIINIVMLMLLYEVGNSSGLHSLTRATWGESSGWIDKSVHNVVSVNMIGSPWAGLESEDDASGWGFSPGSVLTTDIFSLVSNKVVLWDWKEFSTPSKTSVSKLKHSLCSPLIEWCTWRG